MQATPDDTTDLRDALAGLAMLALMFRGLADDREALASLAYAPSRCDARRPC